MAIPMPRCLAPSTPQEMLDLTMLAFDLAMKYRHPVVIAADGYLGQMTGRVCLPETMMEPGIPEWAVWGDEMHRGNLITSIYLNESDLEAHNIHLNEKYERMIEPSEQRADLFFCDDAEWLVVACNTPGSHGQGGGRGDAQGGCQGRSLSADLPVALPHRPATRVAATSTHTALLVVEAGNGQLEDELRIALSYAGVQQPATHHHHPPLWRHPAAARQEIVDKLSRPGRGGSMSETPSSSTRTSSATPTVRDSRARAPTTAPAAVTD